MLDKSVTLNMAIAFQLLLQLLISQLLVVGEPAYLYHVTINIKSIFSWQQPSKTVPNVSPLLSSTLKYVHTKMTMRQQLIETLHV